MDSSRCWHSRCGVPSATSRVVLALTLRLRAGLVATTLLVAGLQVAPRRADAQDPQVATPTSPRVNARRGPAIESAVVFSVGQGVRLVVIETKDGWTLVRWNNVEGWIRSDLLRFETVRAAPESPRVAAPPVTRADTVNRTTQAPKADSISNPAVVTAAPPTRVEDDPRLAGRRRSSGGRDPYASRDSSLLGVLGGLAFGSYYNVMTLGPAARGFVRLPIPGSPIVGRVDLELSQTTSSYGEDFAGTTVEADSRVRSVRALAGAEFGIPMSETIEFSVVGGIGMARIMERVTTRYGGTENVAYDVSRWSFAHDVGVGTKIGKQLLVELHFFTSDGAPFRLFVGGRL